MKVIMVGTCRFWMEAGCQSNQPCEKEELDISALFLFYGEGRDWDDHQFDVICNRQVVESAWVLISRWMDKDSVVQIPCWVWFNCKERNDTTCQSIEELKIVTLKAMGQTWKDSITHFLPFVKSIGKKRICKQKGTISGEEEQGGGQERTLGEYNQSA